MKDTKSYARLTLSCLDKTFSRHFKILFLIFPGKPDLTISYWLDILCKLSTMETICMKYQILFSGKNKENITNLSTCKLYRGVFVMHSPYSPTSQTMPDTPRLTQQKVRLNRTKQENMKKPLKSRHVTPQNRNNTGTILGRAVVNYWISPESGKGNNRKLPTSLLHSWENLCTSSSNLVYINNIAEFLVSLTRLFADDSALLYSETNHDLRMLAWAAQWLINFNPLKLK